MRQEKFWLTMCGILAVALMLPAGAWAASKVLYKFTGGTDGGYPWAGLIFDPAGNLYGTASSGGNLSCNGGGGCGTVFELTPSSKGWTETTVYAFGGNDGQYPVGSLVFDKAGNLYGTTVGGGTYGYGTVFKLMPNSDGTWKESVLHSFNVTDGAAPQDGLIFDVAGNLYGTTDSGGDHGYGTVFELMPNSDGTWKESVLHSFNFTVTDGASPFGSVSFDAAGNLYGTTTAGGNHGLGVVFKLTPSSGGGWTERVLYSFCALADCSDGSVPQAGVIFDQSGNLYGTTLTGGGSSSCSGGCGTVFKLTPQGNGRWTESVLHHFKNHPAAGPWAGVIFDAVGNLHGTTNYGSSAGGVVFKLTPHSDGSWAYGTPHVFRGKPAANPLATPVLDKAGNLYGTTFQCGSGQKCQGVVFEITP